MVGGFGRDFGPRNAGLAFLVVISLAFAPVGAAFGATTAGPLSPGLAGNVDADSVVMYVDLRPDGTADWRVEYRIRLNDDNDTAAFESMRDDIESDPASYRERFAEGIYRTVGDAENATGREMSAGKFAVGTEVRQLPNDYGIVYYTFEWTNFAATDGETVRAGDALAGLFLDAETTLQMEWPVGYQLHEAAPKPTSTQSRAVSWTGSINFADGEPLVAVEPVPTNTPGSEPTTASTTSDGGNDEVGNIPSWVVIAALMLAVVPMAVWLTRRRSVHVSQTAGSETETTQPDDDSNDEPAAGPPDELLSNEERVLKLLDEHGGRIKQQEVVETLDWTDAKTSQVVGKLRDDGEISVFRLGRENVLTLPDEEL